MVLTPTAASCLLGIRAARLALAGVATTAQQWHLCARYSTVPEPDDAHLYAEQLEAPKFVHPVSINQLDTLVRQPSLRLLVNSATFLKTQLPARLENHIHRLKALPTPTRGSLHDLLAGTIISKQRGLEVAQDWKLVDTSDESGLCRFDAHLAEFREHLEVEVSRLTASAQALTAQRGWWDNTQQVRWLNRMLDLCHWYLLSTRVMLTQHSAALCALQQQQQQGGGGSSSSSPSSSRGGGVVAGAATIAAAAVDDVQHYHEPGHKSTVPDQPYTPPHQQLSGVSRPVSLIQRHTPVKGLLQGVVEDCRAFCVEKNSAAPDVTILGDDSTTATLVVPYVEFVLTEVLKNSLQAVINRYGAWEVDDAPPVKVEVEEVDGTADQGSSTPTNRGQEGSTAAAASNSKVRCIRIKVTDMGPGIPPNQMEPMFSYFYSSNKPASTLYGYSRNHGSQFQGQGVGVPMARVYAHFMGGSIEWETEAWRRHTTVTITLPKHGFTF